MRMLVWGGRPSSSSALRNAARLLSAFLMPASEVGPLMPGVTVFRLSPWLCWLPSGSRDQNTSTNGLFARLEHRQQHLGGDVDEIGLLGGIWHQRARRLGVADLAILAARGRCQRQACLGERILDFFGQRHAIFAA